MINRDNQMIAATELEELEAPLVEIVRLLRAGQSDTLAYALVYQLRWRLGYVVRRLGGGVQSTYKYHSDTATQVIESQIWNSREGKGT